MTTDKFADPLMDGFAEMLYLKDRLSENTLSAYMCDLKAFKRELEARGLDWKSAGREDCESVLFDNDKSPATQARVLSSLKRFYDYLRREGQIDSNCVEGIKSPKTARRLPNVISEKMIDRLLMTPDTSTILGLRDKAFLEFLYSTGLRVSEAVDMRLTDVDMRNRVVRAVGKGDKERLAPLSSFALSYVRHYIYTSRPALLKRRESDYLFVSQKREKMSRQLAWMIVNKYAEQVGIHNVSPHTLRHAFATHMVNNGANLRTVQKLLGHADIGTTQIYTHIADAHLKDVVKAGHPRFFDDSAPASNGAAANPETAAGSAQYATGPRADEPFADDKSQD